MLSRWMQIIGGADNPHREGLVTFALEGWDGADLVAALNARRVRTHVRKADHYSGSVLGPLGIESSVRISFGHYNTEGEVLRCIEALGEIVGAARS